MRKARAAGFIPVYVDLIGHPKTARLANRLGLRPLYAAAHLIALWSWALNYAKSGKLADVEDVALAAQWDGDADTFAQELVNTGWLTLNGSGFAIHEWDKYGGQIFKWREYHAGYMRDWRRKDDTLSDEEARRREAERLGIELPEEDIELLDSLGVQRGDEAV